MKVLQERNNTLMNAILRNTIEERRLSLLSNLKHDFSEMEEIAHDHKARIKELLDLPENNRCADCNAAGTTPGRSYRIGVC